MAAKGGEEEINGDVGMKLIGLPHGKWFSCLD